MNFLLTLFLFVIIIGLLVLVHEFGHFITAKLLKVPVKEFAIGFGPTIFSKEYKETHYKLNIIPMGGYVSLEGEKDKTNPSGFRNQKLHAKIIILLGGVFMNLITAIIFFSIFLVKSDHKYTIAGLIDYEFNNTNEQLKLNPIFVNKPEAEFGWEGLDENEVIVGIDNKYFESYKEFSSLVESNIGKQMQFQTLDLDTSQLENKNVTVGGYFKGEYLLAKVTSVSEEGRSYNILRSGVNIVSINGTKFKSNPEFYGLLASAQNSEVELGLLDKETSEVTFVKLNLGSKKENGALLDVTIHFDYGLNEDYYDFPIYYIEFNKNLISPVVFTYDLTIYQFRVLGNQFSQAFEEGNLKPISDSLGGPVAVTKSINEIVNAGIFDILLLMSGLLSLSLAIFNILPIPALDGGQVAIYTLESLLRKEFKDETVSKINFIGFSFLIGLSILIFFKDLVQFEVFGNALEIIRKVLGK